ncbi:peptidylprolyl isomerase [bacterium]|nr:peptidylprolyl isomerase [bacterium]
MAILGKIRQRSIFLILVIGMALFAFVISGVIDGSSQNVGPSDPVGIVNDDKIDSDFFRQMVEQTERTYNFSTIKSLNLVWNQTLRNTIFEQEFEKLGIDAGKDQLEQIISSDDNLINNPNFQNDAGFFDFQIFSDYIAQLKTQNPSAYENWKFQEKSIIGVAKQRIYLDLIKASTSMTIAEAKDHYHLENDNVNIKYAYIPYDIIDDSVIKINDSEVSKYIRDNKLKYEKDKSTSIQLVTFEDVPTEDDLQEIRSRLDALKTKQIVYNEVSKLTDTIEGFKQIDDIVEFIDLYSEVPFDSVYKPRGRFNNEYADILFGLEKGEVFGPYRDNNDFKLSKLIDIKKNASIRASHILISYEGATRANTNVSRTEKEAKNLANRVYREARRSSTDFAELAMKYSDGPTKNSGGDLGFFQQGQMAEEFFTFANTNRVGKLGIVKTEFGYHIIEITDKDDLALIADVVIKAVPSDKTSNEVFRKATQFEMESKNDKDFAKIAQNNNYEIRTVSQISELEENLPGLPKQRNIVRWTFEEDSSIGDVKRFTLNSGGYVVVQITEKIDKGLSSIENVGEEVRKIISKKKKEAIIKKRYKDIQNLDSFAKEDKVIIETASAINQKNPTIPSTGNEPFVVGTAFALNEGKTSNLIAGEKGVYMVVLLKKNIVPDLDDYSSYSKLILKNSSQNLAENIFTALKSVANIEDNRAQYY